jgi:hypothetical protein
MVREGTKLDAIWEASHANAEHGMPLDGDGKRAAVMNILKNEEGLAQQKGVRVGNDQIAKWVGCGKHIVIAMRTALEKAKADALANKAKSNGKSNGKANGKPKAKSNGKPPEPEKVLGSDGRVRLKPNSGGKKRGAGRPSKEKAEYLAKQLKADPLGVPVPEWLTGVVHAAAEMNDLLNYFVDSYDLVTRRLLAIQSEPSGGGKFLPVKEIMASMEAFHSEARQAILGAQYTHVCPECAELEKPSPSCDCKGRGWYTGATDSAARMAGVSGL